MSPYGTIKVCYTAEVQIPQDIHDVYYFTREFGLFRDLAAKDATCYGEDSYNFPLPTQWAEFLHREDAEDFIQYWHNRILEWQERLRSMPNR